jgi:dihydrolipoamide dehydrogenase
VPLEVLRDVIQPFPTFSEIFVKALDDLGVAIGDCPTTAGLAAASA